MASGDMKIRAELRPCEVDGKRALFHGWSNGVLRASFGNDYFRTHDVVNALIEYEGGQVAEVGPEKVRFTDNLHALYFWPEPKANATPTPEEMRETLRGVIEDVKCADMAGYGPSR